jgi:hypothetical protein
MVFRFLNIGSPVTLGTLMCGKPEMSLSDVDAIMAGARRAGVVPCYGCINNLEWSKFSIRGEMI